MSTQAVITTERYDLGRKCLGLVPQGESIEGAAQPLKYQERDVSENFVALDTIEIGRLAKPRQRRGLDRVNRQEYV